MCLVFCSILLTSCASVVTFVDQGGFEQTIEVNTIPENVSVMKDGKIIGETPLTVSFSRKKNFSLTLKNEGYRTEHIRVTRKLNSWVYGNLPIATLSLSYIKFRNITFLLICHNRILRDFLFL